MEQVIISGRKAITFSSSRVFSRATNRAARGPAFMHSSKATLCDHSPLLRWAHMTALQVTLDAGTRRPRNVKQCQSQDQACHFPEHGPTSLQVTGVGLPLPTKQCRSRKHSSLPELHTRSQASNTESLRTESRRQFTDRQISRNFLGLKLKLTALVHGSAHRGRVVATRSQCRGCCWLPQFAFAFWGLRR